MPAYSQLLVASDGRAWAKLYSSDFLAPGVWHVFGVDHVWLGRVDTPASFLMMSIRTEIMAGVWRDALGVEHVRVYRVRPS